MRPDQNRKLFGELVKDPALTFRRGFKQAISTHRTVSEYRESRASAALPYTVSGWPMAASAETMSTVPKTSS